MTGGRRGGARICRSAPPRPPGGGRRIATAPRLWLGRSIPACSSGRRRIVLTTRAATPTRSLPAWSDVAEACALVRFEVANIDRRTGCRWRGGTVPCDCLLRFAGDRWSRLSRSSGSSPPLPAAPTPPTASATSRPRRSTTPMRRGLPTTESPPAVQRGKYCPNDPVTRGQMAAFLHRLVSVRNRPATCAGNQFLPDAGGSGYGSFGSLRWREWLGRLSVQHGAAGWRHGDLRGVRRRQFRPTGEFEGGALFATNLVTNIGSEVPMAGVGGTGIAASPGHAILTDASISAPVVDNGSASYTALAVPKGRRKRSALGYDRHLLLRRNPGAVSRGKDAQPAPHRATRDGCNARSVGHRGRAGRRSLRDPHLRRCADRRLLPCDASWAKETGITVGCGDFDQYCPRIR